MKEKKALFYLYAAGVMVLLLYSLHVYFLWWMYDSTIYRFVVDLFVSITGFIYIGSRHVPKERVERIIVPFIVFWIVTAWNPLGPSWIIFMCPFTLLTLLLLDRLTLRKLLDIWTKLYAVILLVSLIAWPLALMGILPSQGIISFADEDGYNYMNYVLCLVNLNLQNFDVVRFCSIFLEPGHIAMIGAFTLYANRFDFKKWTTWVILVAVLVALSLAGYVLLVLGLVLIRIQQTSISKSVLALTGILLLLVIVYNVSISYNGGDNLINNLIIERLELDDEKGITGNNRFIGDTDYVFDNFLSSSDFLTGLSKDKYYDYIESKYIGGAGYKLYLLEVGLLGIIITLLGYLLLVRRSLDKRFVYCFLFLYIAAFMQRAWPTSHIWLFLFVCATSIEPCSYKIKR